MYKKLCVVLLAVSLLMGCEYLPKGETKTPIEGENYWRRCCKSHIICGG